MTRSRALAALALARAPHPKRVANIGFGHGHAMQVRLGADRSLRALCGLSSPSALGLYAASRHGCEVPWVFDRPCARRFANVQPMARSEFRLAHRLQVRWSEVDPQNIVFNPHYLTYFDVAASEYWRALGFTYPAEFTAREIDTFVAAAKLDFHRSARYDDELEVCARTTRIGRTSLRLAFEIHRASDHLVTGELVYVIADVKTQKPCVIPESLRAAILSFEHVAPER